MSKSYYKLEVDSNLLQEGRTIVNDDCTQELQDYLSKF